MMQWKNLNNQNGQKNEVTQKITSDALKTYKQRRKTAKATSAALYKEAQARNLKKQARCEQKEREDKEKSETIERMYSEANQVFMCIRITRELKVVYE